MHMPGHKRMQVPGSSLPYDIDVTEVEDTDNLHDAHGMLKEAMDRTSALCGSAKTWYLVGGSTAGILSGIRSLAPFGSEVIAARNCHMSVYHAIELGHLKAHWIFPPVLEDFRIPGSIDPQSVERMLTEHPASRAVIITSPTYEGIVSDCRRIAEICHSHGAALFVDEAHGAHFGLFGSDGAGNSGMDKVAAGGAAPAKRSFPDSSIHLGADLVVQSAHKTLPALTQTAFLHIGRNPDGSPSRFAGEEEVERNLSVFETSSPSYPLMASLDTCTRFLEKNGEELFTRWLALLADFRESTKDLKNIRIFDREVSDDASGIGASGSRQCFDADPGKILIRSPLPAKQLAGLLRKDFRIETEMASGRNILVMTGCMDTEENFLRLKEALRAIDGMTSQIALRSENSPDEKEEENSEEFLPAGPEEVQTVFSIGEAAEMEKIPVPVREAEGRICAQYITPYPPGIPVLAPGERIRGKDLRIISKTLNGQDNVQVIVI